jgi:MinD-like ATPase involved in chromosome partitioning or flagellar assembly
VNPRDVAPQDVDMRGGTAPHPQDTDGGEPAAEGPVGPDRGAAKEPPKPWSKGLSRPLRDPSRDALVWPPQGEPGAEARPGTGTRRRTSERAAGGSASAPAPGSPGGSPGSPPRQGRPQRVHGFGATPPPPDRADRSAAGGPVSPQGGAAAPYPQATPAGRNPPAAATPGPLGEQPSSAGPEEHGSHGAPGTGEGPGADAMPDTVPNATQETYAPPRQVRSAPASPVHQRPLPPQPAPPPQEITPPGTGHDVRAGGLRRLIQAIGGGHGQVDSGYEDRLRRPVQGSRHIVVLGCTGGAGQTVTALMLGHTFAQYGSQPVVAIDVNPGPGALARRTRSETNATLTGLITRADQVNTFTAMRRYTSHAKSGLDVITAGKNPLQALDDRDYALAIRTLDRFYSVTMLDTAAAVVARVLPYADQIVLVAPASADAPRAVAMTFEWLDGHGYDGLRSHAVTVINGVSRRSMDDVEQAEAVARGRCRALVRIPWDDHLSLDRSPRNELKSLRAPTRRAYLALAGVVAGGFAAVPERYRQQEASR